MFDKSDIIVYFETFKMRVVGRIGVILLLIGILVVLLVLPGTKNDKIHEVIYQKPRSGVAVIMTGAAARIPQEAALLEELEKKGLLKDLVFISGVSSGALNSVILNGIMSGKITWDEYKDILFNLKTSDIFIQGREKIPVNSAPARALYKRVAGARLGYFKIGDLPYCTSISFTHINDIDFKKTVYRMCSRKINAESDTSVSLVDIMMASSAFPIVFPPVRIEDVKTLPDQEYVDGGIGEDHVPYHALLQFEKYRGEGVEKVYIISRQIEKTPDISEELRVLGINDKGIFDKLGVSIDAILRKGIIKGLRAYANDAPQLVPHTEVWIPDLKNDFLLFSFDDLKEQYEETSHWAQNHDPVPLSEFLQQHTEK